MDVKKGASRVLVAALSSLSLTGGVSTHAMKPNRNSPFSFFTKKLEKGKKTNKSVVGKFTYPGDYPRMKEFMFNHFNNFEIHSDEFWNEDIRDLVVEPARAVIASDRDHRLKAYKQFQKVLNKVFKGNYRFSEEILCIIADYINNIGIQEIATRRGILLTIIREFGILSDLPNRTKPFRPGIVRSGQSPLILNNFPENFLSLPQVE